MEFPSGLKSQFNLLTQSTEWLAITQTERVGTTVVLHLQQTTAVDYVHKTSHPQIQGPKAVGYEKAFFKKPVASDKA
jgi:hypothetical protein